MELKWLEDFVALAELSSFSRAAEARNVTQPAFSRRIRQLEAWVGVPLISRATMPAEMTPAGRQFLPVAQEAIRSFYSARELLRPASAQGLVRFAALHTLMVAFFPQWFDALRPHTGEVGASMLPDRGGIEANMALLTDGEADFLLTYAHRDVPVHLDHDRFSTLTIGTDRLIAVAAPQVRVGKALQPGQELLDRAIQGELAVPYLSYGHSSFFGVALGRLFARLPQFRHRTIHENTISAGLKNLALNGAGLCWLPESLIGQELAAGALVVATQDGDLTLDLDIRLCRSADSRNRTVEAVWRAAQQLAGSR